MVLVFLFFDWVSLFETVFSISYIILVCCTSDIIETSDPSDQR